jgi:predicted TIM-barrel fold metal-dependent hydrolase
MSGRIDVHHHFTSPEYIDTASKVASLSPALRGWSPAQALESMERAGIRCAVLSLTVPGVSASDPGTARSLARHCNEFAAELRRKHPGSFGSFAVLPLPDVQGCLDEIPYAFDQLGANGVEMFTSYGTQWLGFAEFDPVFAALNERNAIVFVHPTSPAHCKSLIPDVNDTIIEFGAESARAVASLTIGGTVSKYPNVRFIFANGGGAMPVLVGRMLDVAAQPNIAPRLPNGLLYEIRRFWYDTARAAIPAAMASLKSIAPVSQILFGTDFPGGNVSAHIEGLQDCGLSAEELNAIEHGNAEALLQL